MRIAILISALLVSAGSSGDQILSYAPVIGTNALGTSRALLVNLSALFTLPDNGVVVGGFSSIPGMKTAPGQYIIIDFDSRTTSRVNLVWRYGAVGGTNTQVAGRESRAVTADELNPIIALANDAWSGKTPPKRTPSVDYVGGIVILDGDRILKGDAPMYGSAWPELENTVQGLWYKTKPASEIAPVGSQPRDSQ